LNENKKRVDDQQVTIDGFDDVKKKMQRDIDALQQRVDTMTDENDRLNKSKKKMQAEVWTYTVGHLENEHFTFVHIFANYWPVFKIF